MIEQMRKGKIEWVLSLGLLAAAAAAGLVTATRPPAVSGGPIVAGVLADKVGLVHGDATIFLRHVASIFIVGSFSFLGSYLLYYVADAAITLRVRPEQEEAGLDLSQHSESL